MAQLNFPDPNVSTTYTEAGITWTWNATLEVWSSETDEEGGSSNVSVGDNPPGSPNSGDLWWNSSDDSGRLYVYYEDANSSQWVEASPQGEGLTESNADGLYLSKVNDDTAAGEITFEGLTTHEDGVSVLGGTEASVETGLYTVSQNTAGLAVCIKQNDVITALETPIYTQVTEPGSTRIRLGADDGLDIRFSGTSISTLPTNKSAATNQVSGLIVSPRLTTALATSFGTYEYVGIESTVRLENEFTTPYSEVSLFRANNFYTNRGNVAGYKSDISIAGGNNRYNFYAGGTAPNFFQGDTHIGGTTAGDNTNITLKSNGSIECLSVVTPLVRTQNLDSFNQDNKSVIGFGDSPQSSAVNIAAKTWGVTDANEYNIGLGLSMFQSTSSSARGDVSSILARPAEAIGITKAGGIYSGFTSLVTEGISTDGFAVGFSAPDIASGNGASAGKNCGFLSSLTTGNTKNYNFYAAGTAPNYYRGNVKVAYDPDVDTLNPQITDGTGVVQIQPQGYVQISRRSGNTDDGCIVMRRAAKGDGLFMRFESATGAASDFEDEAVFRLNGYGGGILGEGFNITTFSIDSRLQSNVQSINNASALVQQLNPISFTNTKTGLTETNFTSAEVETVAPQAVYGSQNATEAIGTLADYDGTVLETEVAEPSELEYTEEIETDGVATMVTRTRSWSLTGTRDVYQGVDQTKLIPLLTKALQEVLTKNEELETRIAALEGA